MADNVDEIRNYDEERNKWGIGIGTAIVIAIMIIVAIIIYFNFIADKKFTTYKNIFSVERDDDGNTKYISYNNNSIIKYSCDGITAIDDKGKKIWSASYEMKNPLAVSCKDSVAVADIGNKTLILYDGKGNAKNVEILKPIQAVAVCSQGIAAVVLEDENCNYIQICDADVVYTEIKTRIKEDGYPISIAYSPNGKKLVTSYVKVSGEATDSLLTFYNFSEVGKNYDSDIVKAEDYDTSIIPQVQFLNESTVVAFCDNKAVVYEMKEIPSKIFETDDYESTIKSVAWDDSYISIVSENESDAKRTLNTYSLNGKKTGNYSLEMNYKNILMSGEDIILYNDNELQIITKNGNEKIRMVNGENISHILPYADDNKLFLVDTDYINLIKLERGK